MFRPERRQLTVMLCDVAGWTALSTQLDAEELADVVQRYRQRCTREIVRQGGIVAQYVGDGILAYFGYPRAHEDDSERAIRAALGIAGTAAAGSAEPVDLAVHIGIATGIVVVGDLSLAPRSRAPGGSHSHEPDALTAVGSAVNLAARLQGLAAPGTVVVAEQTRRLSRGIFEYDDLGRHELKGFAEPVRAWRVIGESRVRSRFQALRAAVLTPLVDRESEQEALRELWSVARGGQGRAVLLSSEPGVGKSRLAEVVARRIVDRRCLRLWFYCAPHLQSTPLAPVIRQLALAAGFADHDNDNIKLRKVRRILPCREDEASEIMPLLAGLLSVAHDGEPAAPSMSPQRQKHLLFQALKRLLQVLAARGPVLLVAEDLHWIDPSSDELLGILIDALKDLPVFAVLTARTEFQSHWDDRAHLLRMHLSPLGRADAIAMIELLCGDRSVAAPTVEQIADRADGLPLFIEDLTRDVLELSDAERADRGRAGGRSPAFAIPATLTDALMSRLDRLGPAKTVAQIGAVIGREFSYELLARIAEGPEEDLREELHRLVDSGLLVSSRSSAVLTYAFRHALVRDAAYSSLLRRNQIELHLRIAEALQTDFAELTELQPEVLAHHYEAAADVDHAVPYLVKAAKRSARRSGFIEAIAQLERALRLLGTQDRSRQRLRHELQVYLLMGAVNAEHRGLSASQCGAAYAAALVRCRELGDAPEIFAVLSGVGAFEMTRANFVQCRSLAHECLALAERQASRRPFVMAQCLLGGTAFLTGALSEAREHVELALDARTNERELGRSSLYVHDPKSTALCYRALTLTLLGQVCAGRRAAEDGLAHSRAIADLHTINYSLCYLAAVLHIGRDGQQAFVRATESLGLAREQRFATWVGISQMIRGAALASQGAHEQGLREIDSGMEAYKDIEAATYQTFGISLGVQGFLWAGRLDEANAGVDQALGIAERTGERFYLPELLRLKGEILARKGEASAAEHWIRAAIDVAHQLQARLFELRSAVSLYRLLGPPHRARIRQDMLQPLCAQFGSSEVAPDLLEAKELIAGGS